MSKLKFELNRKGVRDLLQSAVMTSVLAEKANAAVASLGPGYSSTSYVGKTRVNASVYAETYEAKRDNMKNNSILKALR